ncbi:hypothetical protein BDN72DRAFT_852594 [Pluteus cervinus]|uniref:Uncharacterized protein n=1 Tax=Pluteus cervinus TaxID=181527 RepID=A0ACD3BIJ5_9AGAR|nr:hypothetical protein BDN72DRAFT_852594 [Pluteus cervinus]
MHQSLRGAGKAAFRRETLTRPDNSHKTKKPRNQKSPLSISKRRQERSRWGKKITRINPMISPNRPRMVGKGLTRKLCQGGRAASRIELLYRVVFEIAQIAQR